MLPSIVYAIRKKILTNLNYVQCLKIAPIEKTWPKRNIVPMKKALYYGPNGKDVVLCKLFFEVEIVIIKDKKDTIPIKFSFMQYMKWARII